MPRHHRLDPTSRNLIARAYRAGARPSEIARDYGCSPSYVINTAKAWETEQALRKLKIMEKEARRQMVPPSIQMPEPVPCGTIITKFGQTIRLPFVSIQHRKV